MKSPDSPANESVFANFTPQDLKDREDFKYLLSVMEKQGAVGVTQPLDYVDSMKYRDSLETFKKQIAPEGSITELFDDIIFDFDGVLYDSTYASYRAAELMLEKTGNKNIPIPETIEDIANSFQAPFKNYYERFGIRFDTPEQIHSFRAAYMEIYKQVDNEHHTQATMFPDVKNSLDRIREAKKQNPNLRTHIISAGFETHIKDALIKANIIDDFDQIHSDCHDKEEMIRKIADASNANRTVMLGDTPSDIKDAQRVDGVRTIAVARGTREHEHLSMYLPDYVVGDLSELFDLKSLSRDLRDKEK